MSYPYDTREDVAREIYSNGWHSEEFRKLYPTWQDFMESDDFNEEMDRLSYDAWMQSTHRAGVQGRIAIAYTVWAKKRGGGKAIVNEVYKMVKESNHLNRLVTLSPLTEMARNFHTKNGAKELQVNEESQNFEYDITLEDWEKALEKAKRFFKIK